LFNVRRVLVSILLLPGLLAVVFSAQWAPSILNFVLGPINDPGYFCTTPDPTPVANLNATVVLQECSAGKTVTISQGATIAVDLQNFFGVDTSDDWHDLGISDSSVLETVVSPSSRGVRPRSDEIAVYRALRVGQSTISAVLRHSGGAGGYAGGYARGHLWSVTVRVT
jgi:hypothetical protein